MGKELILTLSGKGGVGKSTISLATALALAKNGVKVGVMDADLENPCICQMTGCSPKDLVIGQKIQPFTWQGIQLMGLSFLSEKFQKEDMPVLIHEDKVGVTINQLLDTINWDTDILIVDMPPGSGSEVRAFIPKSVSGCIIVTSPQTVSEKAVARTIKMCHHYHLPIVGLVQNNLNNFGGRAGKALSDKYNIPLIARVPWDKEVARATEAQHPISTKHFEKIAEVIINAKTKGFPSTGPRRNK